ncbi:MAG TPA: aminopeptidase [Clostridiales bacterium]|nr:aminopeptidase [Clostridiales bacterium]
MKDPRIKELADIIVSYSCRVQPGDNVLIESIGSDHTLAGALIARVYQAGGNPYLELGSPPLQRGLIAGASRELFASMADMHMERMRQMQAYIGIRGSENIFELSLVPDEKMNLYQEVYSKPVHLDLRVKNTKWCILRYPNPSMAQLARMSTEEFEDFYFDVCTLDYQRMSRAMDVLSEYMRKADRVRITGAGTDLAFSIQGLPPIKCAGEFNIPDGEIFTAPVRDSVNGVIQYNTPSSYHGVTFENVRLTFKNGRIDEISASNDVSRLIKIFDTDEGARYIGEFSFGVNPYITKPMNDTLFDEKIQGSFHFTPGAAYTECDNGNKSAVHWDMVMIQRPEYGGGEIWFDDILIRRDGLFVPADLQCLNPDQLKKSAGMPFGEASGQV